MPCSVPTRNLVGWGWEAGGSSCQQDGDSMVWVLLQLEPWDPPPLGGSGTEMPAGPCVFGAHQLPILLRASGPWLCPQRTALRPAGLPLLPVGGGHRDTHHGGCKVQGAGTQSLLQLIFLGDVQDQLLAGLRQLADVPPQHLRGQDVAGAVGAAPSTVGGDGGGPGAQRLPRAWILCCRGAEWAQEALSGPLRSPWPLPCSSPSPARQWSLRSTRCPFGRAASTPRTRGPCG